MKLSTKDNPTVLERVATLEEAVKNINSELGDVKMDLKDLKNILIGDDGKGGFMARLTKIETLLSTYPRALTILVGVVTLVVSIPKLFELLTWLATH